jgi:hypothetical protein
MFIISKASLPTASLPAVSLPIAAIGTPVPGAPTSLIATNGVGDAIDLAWTAPTGEPVTGYNVYRAISGSGSYTRIASTVAPTVTYTDSTSVSGTTYDYYVTATNPGGESGASNVETITALVVDQVTGLSINLVDNTGVLTWDAVSGADGYEVERSPTGAGTWTQIDDVAGETATDTYTSADIDYDYRVRAYIGVDFGAYSATVTVVFPSKPDLAAWLAYWKLEEGSGTSVANSGAGTGRAGTLVARTGATVPSWGTDVGMGGDIITLGDAGAEVVTNAMNVALSSADIIAPQAFYALVNLSDLTNYDSVFQFSDYREMSNQRGVDFFANYTGQIRLGVRYGAGAHALTATLESAGVSAGQIILMGYTLTQEGDKRYARIFVNGVQVAETEITNWPNSSWTSTAPTPCVGHSSDNTGGPPSTNAIWGLHGKVAWAAFDDAGKTPAEMIAIYTGLGL